MDNIHFFTHDIPTEQTFKIPCQNALSGKNTSAKEGTAGSVQNRLFLTTPTLSFNGGDSTLQSLTLAARNKSIWRVLCLRAFCILRAVIMSLGRRRST
jgi:hypothetical protein